MVYCRDILAKQAGPSADTWVVMQHARRVGMLVCTLPGRTSGDTDVSRILGTKLPTSSASTFK